MGTTLSIPHQEQASIESQMVVVHVRKHGLLRVIQVFGEVAPFEEHTWSKIYEAVKKFDESAAKKIKEHHKKLTELCKP